LLGTKRHEKIDIDGNVTEPATAGFMKQLFINLVDLARRLTPSEQPLLVTISTRQNERARMRD
jgi:signal transduction histidine kinase